MRSHGLAGVRLIAVGMGMLLPVLPPVYAQNEGIGTFNSLVGQAIATPPEPPPAEPEAMQMQAAAVGAPGGGKAMVEPTGAPGVKAPTIYYVPALEYDYRFNQQKTGDRFSTDVNEIHGSLSWSRSSTKFLAEYFHIWSDGSNDAMARKMGEANGVKASFTQTLFHEASPSGPQIARDVLFSLPFSFSANDTVTSSPFTRENSDTNSYTLNPFLVWAISWPLGKSDTPEHYRNLKLSLSPGYRLVLSRKEITSGNAPDVNGRRGFVSVLPRIDYDATNLVSLNASVGWNYLTNFYSSDRADAPARNGFSLAAGIEVRPRIFEKDQTPNRLEAEARALSISLSYQYDGFNPDGYQHSVTLFATYRFW